MLSIRTLLFSMLVFTCCCSCSSDDDAPDVPLADVALSFADSLYYIHHAPPLGLWSRDDHANQALDYVAFANNVMIMYVQRYLTPSQWTEVLVEQPVAAEPGVKYRTRTWFIYNDNEYAYQVSQQRGRYVFEGFVRKGEAWKPVMYAEEYPDRSRGLMKVYSRATDDIITEGTWERRDDKFNLILKYPAAKYHELHMNIDEKTGAGTVNHWQDEQHVYDVTWDAQGSGSWIRYNAGGGVDATGAWEADE